MPAITAPGQTSRQVGSAAVRYRNIAASTMMLITTVAASNAMRPADRKPRRIHERRDRNAADLSGTDEEQSEQRLAALLGHRVTMVDLDFPDVVLRSLHRHESPSSPTTGQHRAR